MGDMNLAFVVLKKLNSTLQPLIEADYVWLETYSNGREQGFAVCNGYHKIAFSENRNSDE
ncbi:MAG: hypothetical protein HY376_01955 [Candidatus Blackburnbacteria bacterium]|nr:hypothetical protein [Candidatus Blackburnbacteria bacterium]